MTFGDARVVIARGLPENWDRHAAQSSPEVRSWAPFAFQRPGGRGDAIDWFIAQRLASDVGAGRIYVAFIEVGVEPASDADVCAHERAFANLPYPFAAEFIRDYSHGPLATDGYVEWTEPVTFFSGTPGNDLSVVAPPMSVPLEMGTMDGAKTHLAMWGMKAGLARWPYGSTAIAILMPEFQFRSLGHSENER